MIWKMVLVYGKSYLFLYRVEVREKYVPHLQTHFPSITTKIEQNFTWKVENS